MFYGLYDVLVPIHFADTDVVQGSSVGRSNSSNNDTLIIIIIGISSLVAVLIVCLVITLAIICKHNCILKLLI